MRNYILLAVALCATLSAKATAHLQVESKMDTVITDTVKNDTVRSDKTRNIELDVSIGKKDRENEKKTKYPRTFGGITFSRIDWGFSRPMDNGSFTMSEENQFLTYGRASNFGFDVAQFGVRLNDGFRIYASTGFEWNYMRLQNNVLLARNQTPLDYEIIDRNEINYRRNTLTSTYLRIPLTFEWRSPRNSKGDRLRVAFGPTTGILLKGSQRLRSDEQGRQGFRDNFNLQSFQYGGFVRIGYESMGVFGKYYFNDMFEQSPAQAGFRNLAFGLTLGF